jgi:hypothetical protein
VTPHDRTCNRRQHPEYAPPSFCICSGAKLSIGKAQKLTCNGNVNLEPPDDPGLMLASRAYSYVEPTGAKVELHHCKSIKSEPHTTPHNMITVHKHSCSKSAETPIFTTYIVQIPARSCGYFPKCTHACSLIACDDNLLQHQTGNSMSIGC